MLCWRWSRELGQKRSSRWKVTAGSSGNLTRISTKTVIWWSGSFAGSSISGALRLGMERWPHAIQPSSPWPPALFGWLNCQQILVLILIILISTGTLISLFVLAYLTDTESQAIGFYATSIGIILVTALVGKRSFELCSVILSDQCVEQLCMFCGRHFIHNKKPLWSKITDIAVKPGAFVLSGRNQKIEINTMVFTNANVEIEYITKKIRQKMQNRRYD